MDYSRKYLKDLENSNIDDITIPAEDNADQRILTQEVREETGKLLHYLSIEDRIIFQKPYIEEKDMDEIAEEMGLSKPNLYNRISRGKRKMRNKIKSRGDY